MIKKIYFLKLLSIVIFIIFNLAVFPCDASENIKKSRPVYLMIISDNINPATAQFFVSGLKNAQKNGAQALILQIDTPGGLDTSMRKMVQAIMDSSIPVIVYIAPGGSRAASAGAIITLAAHIAVMAPGTNIGAAHPVSATGGKMDKTMTEKVMNDMTAYVKSIADARKRDTKWAVDIVNKSRSATANEALNAGIIDFITPDRIRLLHELDGRSVMIKNNRVELKTLNARIITIESSFKDRILSVISNPNLAYILMLIGMAGLYFEFSNPGSLFPGIIGSISLVLALFAFQTLPVNYAGVIIIIIGLICFIAEIYTPTYGFLSITGIICLILGSIMLFNNGDKETSLSLSVLIPSIVMFSSFFSIVAFMAVKAQLLKPSTGQEGIINEEGVVIDISNNYYKVFLHGEIWNAVSDKTLNKGQKIKVTGIKNLLLYIKPKEDTLLE